jgi:hypothetical protein
MMGERSTAYRPILGGRLRRMNEAEVRREDVSEGESGLTTAAATTDSRQILAL